MRALLILGLVCCVACEDCDCRGTIEGAGALAAEAREGMTAADRARIAELEPEARRFLQTHAVLLERVGSVESIEASTLAGFPMILSGTAGSAEAVEITYDVRGPRGEVRHVNVGFVREGDGWVATSRRGEIRARAVVANLLPAALGALTGGAPPRALQAKSEALEDAWGAAMIYAIARPPAGGRDDAHHLQLVGDASLPLVEGNHVFVSASGAAEIDRAPAGRRTLTVSTHVPLAKMRRPDVAGYVRGVQDTMRRTLAARAPEWFAGIEHQLPASPRTFARFVGRPHGAVGGLPRRASLASYAEIGPQEVLEGVWLVGDSVFPGQSALATALGGVRTAAAVSRSL